MRPIVALLTDFGTRDSYVASLKGAVLSICREAILVDISHDVAPHDVSEAAYVLDGCRGSFPDGTTFLVVVDPGVGTQRRGIVVAERGKVYVGPDNGVFGLVLAGPGAVAREIRTGSLVAQVVAPTFHGRDIFAPVAGHLAAGLDLSSVGPVIADAVRLRAARCTRRPDGLVETQVEHVDHFGNVITGLALPRAAARSSSLVAVFGRGAAERTLPLVTTYGDVAPGEACALVGSGGRLEIAINSGHAARELGLAIGSAVRLRGLPPGALAADML